MRREHLPALNEFRFQLLFNLVKLDSSSGSNLFPNFTTVKIENIMMSYLRDSEFPTHLRILSRNWMII